MRKILFVALIGLLAAGTAMAQSARGGIQGTVLDDGGTALPGVTVVLTSDVLQGSRTATSDSNGFFRFPLLPPGVYKAVFTLSGFQRVEQENVRVPLEGTITLDVAMTSTFTEEVVVTSESPVIDVTSTSMGSTIGEQVLADVPVGRDFKSITYLATGAVDGGGIYDEDIGSNPSIMGASALENRYVVDQLDTTDPAFGKAGTQISTSFISEVQVKTAGYEAEYGGALGGVVNMITKSGGNEFHGDVFGYYSNKDMWADAEIPETRGASKTTDEEMDLGFTLGGKFIEDKLWYFVGYNPNWFDQNIRADVWSASDELVRTNEFIREFTTDYLTAKLTWRLSDAHSLSLNALGDPTEIENDYYSYLYVDSPYYPTNVFYETHKKGGYNYGLNWNSIFSESVFLEVMVGHFESTDTYLPREDWYAYMDQTADGRFSGGVGNSAIFGGPGFVQFKDDRTRDQARAALAVFIGDSHEFKFGGGYSAVEYDMDYGMAGSSEAYCVPPPTADSGWFGDEYAWALDLGTGEYAPLPYTCDRDDDGVMDGYQMPARRGNRWIFRNSYYYNRNYENISLGETSEYNLYAQDAWRLLDNFTVSLGVRAESSKSEGYQTDVRGRSLDFDFGDMVAPRVGLVWDPAANGRSKVFAHYGKFYESIPLDINVRALGEEYYNFFYYNYPAEGLPGPTNSGEFVYYLSSRSEYTLIDPDLKPQYLEEYVLGGEYEVMTDLAVGVKYIRRELGRVIEDISVDGGASYFVTNPGGYYDYNPATGTPLADPVTFPYPERNFEGVELSLNKRFSNNWQVYSSFLWSELKGNYEGLYARDNRQIDPNLTSKYDLPELLTNAYGLLQNDREWQFKTYGSYRFDFGLVTGVSMFWLNGNPLSKLGAHSTYGLDERYVTPRGSEGRSEDWMNWDFHLSYPIDIADFQLELMLDVFNLFDEQAAVEVEQRWTVYDEIDLTLDADEDGCIDIDANCDGTVSTEEQQTNNDWGEALTYAPPQRIRVGLKFSW